MRIEQKRILLLTVFLCISGCISFSDPTQTEENIEQPTSTPKTNELAPHAYDSKEWSYVMPHTIIHKCKPEMLEPIGRELYSKGYAVIHREDSASGVQRKNVSRFAADIGAEYVLQTDTSIVYYAHPPRKR